MLPLNRNSALIVLSMSDKITPNTAISIGLVITLLAAAVSFGVMYQRVTELDRRMARVEDKLDTLLSQKALAQSHAGLQSN